MPSLRQASACTTAAVAGAVVGEQLLDFDPVAAVEGDGAAQEAGSGGCLLVVEDLGVGEAAVVVDGDMNELPAGDAGAAPVDPRLLLARRGCR